ncbi:MAG: alpha/beta hydrolase [Myxococcaceae bacterium]|nr:alpha/beta hydrolase [Myxococcaceae bacterium]
MPSAQALQLWAAFRAGPKQVDLALPQRREASERAEGPTAEPVGITYQEAPEVGGLWAVPRAAREGAAVLYLFGGGYVLGSPASRRKTAGHLATATGARVLVPSYRLAPEHPFPAALEDAVRAWRWLLGQGARADRSVVMGDSSGGGLAVATLLALRQQRERLPAGCVPLSPWADLLCTGESMRTRAAVDMMCTRDSLLEMGRWYLAGHEAQDPLASPLYGDFTGLPSLLALVGGDEVLRDDAVRLVCAAASGGADATLFIGAGMQHVWPIWAGALPEADAALGMIGTWVRERTS